jgi:hypothetical protein
VSLFLGDLIHADSQRETSDPTSLAAAREWLLARVPHDFLRTRQILADADKPVQVKTRSGTFQIVPYIPVYTVG